MSLCQNIQFRYQSTYSIRRCLDHGERSPSSRVRVFNITNATKPESKAPLIPRDGTLTPNSIGRMMVSLPGAPRQNHPGLANTLRSLKTLRKQKSNSNTSPESETKQHDALTSTGHPLLLNLATEWMTRCCQTHSLCEQGREDRWYPCRLVDVLHGRLILTSDTHPSGPYTTLSYCWGPNPSFLSLSADNLHQFCSVLPMELMPAVFLDAFEVTRKLGIRYIWIDALCILQSGKKSAEDWQLQSAQMSKIYANCLVNITASHATSPKEGCFASRHHFVKPGFNALSSLSVHSLSESAVYTLVDAQPYLDELDTSPLSRRAWVLQERLMSPRILTFGKSRIFWQCSEDSMASDFPASLNPFGFFFGSMLHPFDALEFSKISSEGSSNGNIIYGWASIVRNYCRRQLTQSSDKLVAISAVAEKVSRHSKDPLYLAGHFRIDLPQSLCWNAASVTQDLRVIEPKTAPTWSWASVEGETIPQVRLFENTKFDATVLSAQVELVNTASPFGQVLGGKIVLQGWSGSLSYFQESKSLKIKELTYYSSIRFDHSKFSCDSCIYLVINPDQSLLLMNVQGVDHEIFIRVGLLSIESISGPAGHRIIEDFHEVYKGSSLRTVTII
jgi:Heterokaryon incompatibility protein (HET)